MAFANITGTATTTLVTGVPGKSIKLLGYVISNDTTNATGFYFAGSVSGAKSATHQLPAPANFGITGGDFVKFTLAPGEDLQLVQTAAGNLGLDYWYNVS